MRRCCVQTLAHSCTWVPFYGKLQLQAALLPTQPTLDLSNCSEPGHANFLSYRPLRPPPIAGPPHEAASHSQTLRPTRPQPHPLANGHSGCPAVSFRLSRQEASLTCAKMEATGLADAKGSSGRLVGQAEGSAPPRRLLPAELRTPGTGVMVTICQSVPNGGKSSPTPAHKGTRSACSNRENFQAQCRCHAAAPTSWQKASRIMPNTLAFSRNGTIPARWVLQGRGSSTPVVSEHLPPSSVET